MNKSIWRCNRHKLVLLLTCMFIVATLTGATLMLSPVAVAEPMYNTVVDTTGAEYVLSGSTDFGTIPGYSVPCVLHGDVDSAFYGKEGDPVSLTLSLNGAKVGTFGRHEWRNYFNASMPAGSYKLTVEVAATSTTLATTKDYTFSVAPIAMPASPAYAALNSALQNRQYTFEWTGNPQFVNEEEISPLVAALQKAIDDNNDTPRRIGVWENKKYNNLYTVELLYNLDGMNITKYENVNNLWNETGAPKLAGVYKVYYMISANNYKPAVDPSSLSIGEYDRVRRSYSYTVVIVEEIAIPEIPDIIYNGKVQKADVPENGNYVVAPYEDCIHVGTYSLTLRLNDNTYKRWEGKKLGEVDCVVTFNIVQATNTWLENPDMLRWTEGKFGLEAIPANPEDSAPAEGEVPAEGELPEEPELPILTEPKSVFTGAALFGNIVYIVTNVDETEVYYDEANDINLLAELKAGTYYLKAYVEGTDDYTGLSFGVNVHVLEKEGLPWWATTIIAVGSALAVLAVLFILWKKGVFQILTGKLVLAIRTQATIDATIAAVRANKIAEKAKESIAAAEAKEKAEARAQAAKEARERPAEEQARELEAKSAAAAQRAERMRAKAESLRNAATTTESAEKPTEEKPAEEKPTDK